MNRPNQPPLKEYEWALRYFLQTDQPFRKVSCIRVVGDARVAVRTIRIEAKKV